MDYITTFEELHKHIGEICEFGFAYSIRNGKVDSYLSQPEWQRENPDQYNDSRLRGRLGVNYYGLYKQPSYGFNQPLLHLNTGEVIRLGDGESIDNEEKLLKMFLRVIPESEVVISSPITLP